MLSVRPLVLASSLLFAASIVGCKAGESTSEEKTSPAANTMSRGSSWQTYGETIEVAEFTDVSLGALKGDERQVVVVGVITEVCTHQGCWIRLKDPSDPAAGDLFVRTKNHAYLVPINSIGREVRVYGTSEFSEMSVNDQKHYAEEAGKSEAQIALITQPRKMITFHADAIAIEGPGLDKPLDQ